MTSTTGTLASTIGQINPLRYRGYYYDAETGWYYLQSRYYDPVVGRFINADEQINDGLLGANLFAYCENNPVNMSDPNGNAPYMVVDGPRNQKGERTYIVVDLGKNQTTVLSPIINKNLDDFDPYYDKNFNEKGRSSDAKRREKNQINDAFGKRDDEDRNDRSGDLHKSKKGKRNDDNQSYSDLKSGNYWDIIIGGAAAAGGIYVAWVIVKWGVAIAAAPPTGGTSLVLALATP